MADIDLGWIPILVGGLVCLSIGFFFNDTIPLPVVYVLMGLGAVLNFYAIFQASESVR